MCISVKIETATRVFHPLPHDRAELSIRCYNNTNHQKERREEDVMSTLRQTFLEELAGTYDAEKQLLKALPKMAQAARHEDLRHVFEEHLEQTEAQVERLEQVFEVLGEEPESKGCKAMEAIIREGEDIIKRRQGDGALICAAQKAEHYEIASYGSLQFWARLLGEEDAADLLEETLDEERDTDDRLMEMAEDVVDTGENQEEGEAEPSKESGRSD
jgi:ferritin-like metal-binding protein YciE